MALAYHSKRLILAGLVGSWLLVSLALLGALHLPRVWIVIWPIGAFAILVAFMVVYGFPGPRAGI